MKKINTFSSNLFRNVDVLTTSQMSAIKGGAASAVAVAVLTDLGLTDVAAVVDATLDDKRRDRPGGGVSTH